MLSIVILAAGKGTRMYSQIPKVLHTLGDKPLLGHVIDTAFALTTENIFIIHGHGAEHVKNAFANYNIHWILQEPQLGTGHAVQQALPFIPDNHNVLVLYGDVPLISQKTLNNLLNQLLNNKLAVLTTKLENPTGYGRIIRNAMGAITAIIEQKDANEEQLKINEINTGFLAAKAEVLKQTLAQVDNNNKQQEYYLTDIIALSVEQNYPVTTYITQDPIEVSGVNNRLQLAELERQYQARKVNHLLLKGVTIKDPNRLDIRGEVIFGQDVEIDIGAILEGRVILGDNVKIGAYTVIRNAEIKANTNIKENCVIEESVIGEHCQIGPFARIRPGSEFQDHVHIGNFVETKKTKIDQGSKANHLTYLGDTTIGKKVNIGAGTITCNYDGVNKHQTIIEDGVFVGSNSQLVAPVKIAKGSTIGAGSTITKDTPEDKLTLSRPKQITIDHWQRPKKKE